MIPGNDRFGRWVLVHSVWQDLDSTRAVAHLRFEGIGSVEAPLQCIPKLGRIARLTVVLPAKDCPKGKPGKSGDER